MPMTCDVKGRRVASVMLISPCGGRVPICRFVLWFSGYLHSDSVFHSATSRRLLGRSRRTAASGAVTIGLRGWALSLHTSPLASPSARHRAAQRTSVVRDQRSFPRKSVYSCGVPEQRPKTLPSAPEEPRPIAVSGNSRGSFPPSVCRVLPKRAEKLRAAVLPDCWRRPQRHVGCSAR